MTDADLVPKGDDDNEEGLLAHPADTADDGPVPDLPEVDDPDPEPGEQLDTGQDIGKTEIAPDQETEFPIDAPAAAVEDPGPPPITPASSAEQYDARVKYENDVNAQVERWIEVNRAAIIDAFVAGDDVTLKVGTGDEPADDADDDASDGELSLPVDPEDA